MADISKLNFGKGDNDIKDAKAFRTDDAAETAIANGDYFPFYDASASAKRKSLWSNIVNTLKTTFAIKSHASSATTYGVGTTANYGHNKVIDDLTKTSFTNGESLSAHMGNVLGTLDAPIETSTTFSKAYTKGQKFIMNGLLYEITADSVSASTTISIGGNCKLGSDLSSRCDNIQKVYYKGTNFLTNTYSGTFTKNAMIKRNGMTCITFIFKLSTSVPSFTSFLTIPKGFYTADYFYTTGWLEAKSGSHSNYQWLVPLIVRGNMIQSGIQLYSGDQIRAYISYIDDSSWADGGWLVNL